MKTLSDKFLPFGLSLIAALPVLAIEPPKDDAPPPPSVKTPASAPTADPTRRIDAPVKNNAVAFIGLITAEVPEMLSTHLGIKPGEGVMIRDLAPGGPAEKAGFQKFDVVTRVAGKSVGSPAELSQRISENQPGDEISIDLIHEGKPAAKTVKLETRPAGTTGLIRDPRIVDPQQLGHLDFEGMPQDQARNLRRMIEGRMRGLNGPNESEPGDDQGNFKFESNATFRLMDNEGSVEMKSRDGKKEITVRDLQNNIVWSGPWNTEEDKAAAGEARERIERFNFDDGLRNGGFRFRMRGAPPFPNGLLGDEE